jgi:hypothetical protein
MVTDLEGTEHDTQAPRVDTRRGFTIREPFGEDHCPLFAFGFEKTLRVTVEADGQAFRFGMQDFHRYGEVVSKLRQSPRGSLIASRVCRLVDPRTQSSILPCEYIGNLHWHSPVIHLELDDEGQFYPDEPIPGTSDDPHPETIAQHSHGAFVISTRTAPSWQGTSDTDSRKHPGDALNPSRARKRYRNFDAKIFADTDQSSGVSGPSRVQSSGTICLRSTSGIGVATVPLSPFIALGESDEELENVHDALLEADQDSVQSIEQPDLRRDSVLAALTQDTVRWIDEVDESNSAEQTLKPFDSNFDDVEGAGFTRPCGPSGQWSTNVVFAASQLLPRDDAFDDDMGWGKSASDDDLCTEEHF